MKANQAWGWLAAGVLAAGLNANYYDGGFQWAHRIADRVGRNSTAVLALASGQVDRFLTEAPILTAHNQPASCRVSTALARIQTRIVQTHIARAQAGFDRFAAMSDRQEAQLDKLEANRERMKALVMVNPVQVRIAPAAFAPVVLQSSPVICPRVRVDIPQLPLMKMKMMPTPAVHVEMPGLGPV
jgi:hypothetical protein